MDDLVDRNEEKNRNRLARSTDLEGGREARFRGFGGSFSDDMLKGLESHSGREKRNSQRSTL